MRILIILLIYPLSYIRGLSTYHFPISEWNALSNFYNNTKGPDWQYRTPYELYGYPWDFSLGYSIKSNPCSDVKRWQGLNCTSNCVTIACNVIQIHLSNTNLTGSISSEISQLKQLIDLKLDFNRLTGTLPTSLFTLQYLKFLDFFLIFS